MVNSCSAYNCTERYKKETADVISFHSFPKEIEIRKRWLHEMRRKNWQPNTQSKLCSKHFTASCYSTSSWSTQKRLKPDAIPTIFDFPEHLKKKTIIPRPSPKKRKSIDNLTKETVLESPGEAAVIIDTPSFEESEPTLIKKRRCYLGDYLKDESLTNSPKIANLLELTQKTLEKKNKQLRIVRQELRRTQEKMKTMESIIIELQNKNLVSDEVSEMITTSVPGKLHKAFIKKLHGKRTGNYSPAIRSFALTLDFYSPKGYEYVRSIFKNSLPHCRTLQKWYQNVKCEPGFSNESIEAIKRKASKSVKPLYGTLMFDEISIRKQVHWDGEKLVGFTDFGNYELSKKVNTGTAAKEALVFMVNCLNQRWKIPVGYFFISSMNAADKANLVEACLRCLSQSGIKIISVTFDGSKTNLSMCERLGASLKDPRNLQPWFYYPDTKKKEKVYIFFDPPHALKLVRNTLAQKKIMYDENDEKIEWSYFQKLSEAQETEGLHLGTKLRKRHIRWYQEKMKVKLAAQTLSQSNATAFKYLRLSNYSEDFVSSKATETFCLVFNNLFDILNSRNKYGERFKQGLQMSNQEMIISELVRVRNYILSLKTTKSPIENYVVDSISKTGFLGFLISIESMILIHSDYVLTKKLDYILSYKMCQDHLEVFFSAIRSKGGHNNNPSAVQFKAAFKRLLMHATIKNTSGNCIEQDDPISILYTNSVEHGQPISILYTSSVIPKYIAHIESTFEELQEETEELNITDEDLSIVPEHGYCKVMGSLSQYVRDVVSYIAGFVVKQLNSIIDCPKCMAALLGNNDTISLFQIIKQYETCKSEYGLTKPSDDVVKLCREVERQYRIYEDRLLEKKNAVEYLTLHTLRETEVHNIFKNLQREHNEDDGPCHVYGLMKMIIAKYLKVRLHYLAKIITEKFLDDTKGRIRHKLTKEILFWNR